MAVSICRIRFTDLHWPDFTKETLLEAIAAYQKRRTSFWWLARGIIDA